MKVLAPFLRHRFLQRRVGPFSRLVANSFSIPAAREVSLDEGRVTDDGKSLQNYFHSVFLAPEDSNIYDVPSGCYQKMNTKDFEKFLPEGSRAMKEDFNFTNQSLWMIRESTKVLCSTIDHARQSLQPSDSTSQTNKYVEKIPKVEIPRFNEGKEWDEAKPQFFQYGRDLRNSNEIADSNDWIGKAFSDGFPEKIMVTGERGVGKSVLLDQVVVHARKSGWLCMYINNGWEQAQGGLFVHPINAEETLFDNPIMTKNVLRSFLKAHQVELSCLNISRPVNKIYLPAIEKFKEERARMKKFAEDGDRSSFIKIRKILQGDDNLPGEDQLDEEFLASLNLDSFKLETLADLIVFGIAFPQFSGMIFGDLVTELKNLTEFPVLIVVDEYNTWFENSAFMYQNQDLSSFQLAVPHHLKFLDIKKATTKDWKLRNGLCVAATSLGRTEGLRHTFRNNISSIPFNVKLPVYNKIEYLSAFTYYSNYGYLEPCFTFEDFMLFRSFTGSIPERMRKESPLFFVPQIFSANDDALEEAMIIGDSGTITSSEFSKEE